MNKKVRITLNESIHRSTLIGKLQDFRTSAAFTDITLVVKGEKFHAHKIILSSFSSYFQSMFLGEMIESRENVVHITGTCTPTGLRIILNYMYSSELDLNHMNVQDILETALYTQVEPVVKACVDFLRVNMDVDNCADIGIIAENYCLNDLKLEVFNFVGGMFSEVAKTKDFHRLTPELITYAVSNDMPIKESELAFLRYILFWFFEGNNEEITTKCQHADEIIRHIRFTQIAPGHLKPMVDQFFREKKLDMRDNVIYKTIEEYSQKKSAFPFCGSTFNMRGMQLAVVKVGGFNSDGLTNDLAFSFVNEKNWRRLTAIPHVEQCNYGTAVLNNELYVIGGCFNQFLQEVIHNFGFKYNSIRNEWVKIKSMLSDRCRFTLTELNGVLYAVAGAIESGADCELEATKTAESYSAEKDEWSYIASLPECRQQHAAASLTYKDTGLLFISGGLHKDRVIASMFMYNTELNIWTSCAPLLSPRADHFMISYKRKLYVGGGWREHPINPQLRVQVTTIDCYDLATDTWTFVTNIPTPRFHTGVVANGSKIYFIGGFHQDTFFRKDTSAIECYDIVSDTWTKDEKKSQDFWEHACVMLYVPKLRSEK